MKNKKNVYVLAIVAMILMLGVGYAVVSQVSLNIAGNASAKTEELKVHYDGVNSGTTANVIAISSPDESRTATFDITDMVYNTPIELEFEIESEESDLNATISYPEITNTKSSFFSVSLEYKAGAKSSAETYSAWTSGTKTLAAGAKATIKVIVTLSHTPIEVADSTTHIEISYTATPASAS